MAAASEDRLCSAPAARACPHAQSEPRGHPMLAAAGAKRGCGQLSPRGGEFKHTVIASLLQEQRRRTRRRTVCVPSLSPWQPCIKWAIPNSCLVSCYCTGFAFQLGSENMPKQTTLKDEYVQFTFKTLACLRQGPSPARLQGDLPSWATKVGYGDQEQGCDTCTPAWGLPSRATSAGTAPAAAAPVRPCACRVVVWGMSVPYCHECTKLHNPAVSTSILYVSH